MIFRERLSAKAIAYLRTSPFVIRSIEHKGNKRASRYTCVWHHKKRKGKPRKMPPMAKSRFDYQNNRWACGNAALARRWYDELERANPENVRASLAQTAGSRGAILIGEVSMTIGFARDWLAWRDQQKALREVRFRRWQFIASASVLLAAIGLALKAWLKW
jgi:hypothetical protein